MCEGFDEDEDMFFGRDYSNGYDVDGKVYFTSKDFVEAGTFVRVKITDATEYDLFGHLA